MWAQVLAEPACIRQAPPLPPALHTSHPTPSKNSEPDSQMLASLTQTGLALDPQCDPKNLKTLQQTFRKWSRKNTDDTTPRGFLVGCLDLQKPLKGHHKSSFSGSRSSLKKTANGLHVGGRLESKILHKLLREGPQEQKKLEPPPCQLKAPKRVYSQFFS